MSLWELLTGLALNAWYWLVDLPPYAWGLAVAIATVLLIVLVDEGGES